MKNDEVKRSLNYFKAAYQFVKDVIDEGESENRKPEEILRDIKLIDFDGEEGEVLAEQLRNYL